MSPSLSICAIRPCHSRFFKGFGRFSTIFCIGERPLPGQDKRAPRMASGRSRCCSALLFVAEVTDGCRVIPPVRPQRARARRGLQIFMQPGRQSPLGSRLCSAKRLTPTSGGGASRRRTGTGSGARSRFTPRSRSSGWTPGYPSSSAPTGQGPPGTPNFHATRQAEPAGFKVLLRKTLDAQQGEQRFAPENRHQAGRSPPVYSS